MKRSMVVSLIGRPNVGKSSLFNRIMRRGQKAITYDLPGVTRDRHYGIATLNELADEKETDIILVDTGGFYPEKIEETGKNDYEVNANKFFNIMTEHAHMAIAESDLVLVVVDVREGLLPFDKQICDSVRAAGKPFWLVLNKFDSDAQWGTEIDFYDLGIDPETMFMTSAAHSLGMEELRQRVQAEALAFGNRTDLEASDLQKGVTPREDVVARVALIGAPNAGKSTLLNQFVGSKRALVSNVAGTTVDPIEGFFDLYFGQDASKLDETVEFSKNDGLLLTQYEEFRMNNLDTFTKMIDAYAVEEGDDVYSEEDVYEVEDLFEMEADDRDSLPENESELIVDELTEEQQDELAQRVFNEEDDESFLEVKEEDEGSFWRSIHLVDTAGIRRQSNVKGYIEEQSVYRSLRCITESDIVVYMVDVTLGIGHQDRRLLDIALEKGKSVIIALNKFDLIQKNFENENEKKEWLMDLRAKIPWLDFCDVIPISAKYNKHTKKLKKALKDTIMVRRRNLPTGELNRLVYEMVERNPVVLKGGGGKRFKVKYVSMLKATPPTFLFFVNRSSGIPEHYRRYLRNALRSYFEIKNTPVHLIFRTGRDLEKRVKVRNKLKRV